MRKVNDDEIDDAMIDGERIPTDNLEDVPEEAMPGQSRHARAKRGPFAPPRLRGHPSLKIFAFAWDVPTEGYQLVSAKVGPVDVRLLTNDVPCRGSSYKVRSTRPLELSGLFLDFAQIADEPGLLAFANKHGCLGLRARRAWYEPGEYMICGEALNDWFAQAKRFRETLSAWDAQDLERVATNITESLDGCVSPRCVLGKQPAMMFEPQHLLAAIWLQLAQMVEGRRKYRRCQGPGCGRWMSISLDEDTRSDRAIYCSGPCRQKAYRGRVKEAG
jgi:hypothetical protein